MPIMLHLADARNGKRILRVGIKGHAHQLWHNGRLLALPKAVYCLPVMPDFYASHQWLRELKRQGVRTILGSYFRLPDDEPVWLGHYGREHQQVSAAEASKLISTAADPLGYEVVVPRSIQRGELQRLRNLPQVVGWRFYPKAHDQLPLRTRIAAA